MNAKNHEADSDLLTRAHVVPFAVFMGFLILLQLASSLIGWDHPDAPWWRRQPAQWVYPVQVIVTLGFLLRYWKCYRFDWSLKWSLVAVVFGAVGIGFWLLPTTLYDAWGMQGEATEWLKRLGFAARREGFDPGIFEHPAAYWSSLIMRFVRAVIVVALVEEIFWRGFLMRFLVREDFEKVRIGEFQWKAFLLVAVFFMLVHSMADWPAAFLCGLVYNFVAVKTGSLAACVVAHSLTNLGLGAYIMATRQWGFW